MRADASCVQVASVHAVCGTSSALWVRRHCAPPSRWTHPHCVCVVLGRRCCLAASSRRCKRRFCTPRRVVHKCTHGASSSILTVCLRRAAACSERCFCLRRDAAHATSPVPRTPRCVSASWPRRTQGERWHRRGVCLARRLCTLVAAVRADGLLRTAPTAGARDLRLLQAHIYCSGGWRRKRGVFELSAADEPLGACFACARLVCGAHCRFRARPQPRDAALGGVFLGFSHAGWMLLFGGRYAPFPAIPRPRWFRVKQAVPHGANARA